MKLRTGRKLGLTIYIQAGDEPSDGDELLGMFLDPARADLFVKIANGESPPLAHELPKFAVVEPLDKPMPPMGADFP